MGEHKERQRWPSKDKKKGADEAMPRALSEKLVGWGGDIGDLLL